MLIFGIDGASPTLVDALAQGGRLPALGAFARQAAVRPLRCSWPPHTATGWTSLFAGRLPGEHGIFQFWDCQAPDYALRVTPRNAAGCASLWDALAGHGWTLGLMNLPMSHPPGPWAGYQMTWPLEPTLHYGRPASLLREIAEAGGLARPDIACMYDGSAEYPARAVEYIRSRTRGLLHLMRTRPVDAVAVVYPEIDRACHHYWHELDPHDPARSDGSVVARLFAEIDDAFAELLAEVGEECLVAVVSDHGFGAATRGLRLHRLLEEGGFCTLREADPAPPTFGDDVARGSAGTASPVVWRRTLAYTPTPGCFGVNLNRAGRQSEGTVRPEDADGVATELAAFLLRQRDPGGDPLFRAVLPAAQAYAGPFASAAPDLLVVPADPGLLLLHDAQGPLWDHPGQTGLHRLEGIFWLGGAGVEPGALEAAGIETVAGRLLDELGIAGPEVPRHPGPADAAPRRAGVPEGAWSSREPAAAPAGPAPVLPTADDTGDVAARMRRMGYW
ncbi:MAG TPA: alkaline phosphatase family protein [Longimicrobiaceae bacterium]